MAAKGKYEQVREELLAALAVYTTDKAACEAVGIGTASLYAWMHHKTGFLESVQRARRNRRMSLVARLAAEDDWRAWEACIKHGPKVLDRREYKRKLSAEADIAEAQARKARAEAEITEALANRSGKGGLIIVGGDDILDVLSDELRERVEIELAGRDAARLGWRRDILPQHEESEP